jgi:hypothetical protein
MDGVLHVYCTSYYLISLLKHHCARTEYISTSTHTHTHTHAPWLLHSRWFQARGQSKPRTRGPACWVCVHVKHRSAVVVYCYVCLVYVAKGSNLASNPALLVTSQVSQWLRRARTGAHAGRNGQSDAASDMSTEHDVLGVDTICCMMCARTSLIRERGGGEREGISRAD